MATIPSYFRPLHHLSPFIDNIHISLPPRRQKRQTSAGVFKRQQLDIQKEQMSVKSRRCRNKSQIQTPDPLCAKGADRELIAGINMECRRPFQMCRDGLCQVRDVVALDGCFSAATLAYTAWKRTAKVVAVYQRASQVQLSRRPCVRSAPWSATTQAVIQAAQSPSSSAECPV